MLARLNFGHQGSVVCDRINLLDCPNSYQGIGDIEVHAFGRRLWTGEIYLIGETFRFHFSQVDKIEVCNDHDPWHLLWLRTSPTNRDTYEDFNEAAQLLRAAMQ